MRDLLIAARPLKLTDVLEALSDPTRRYILRRLAQDDACCSSFCDLGQKTKLTYHFARLEKAGLIRRNRSGRRVILTLDRRTVNFQFPGLLNSVLKVDETDTAQLS
jgi:DNA-binding transcriptional ArsR family regulator